MLQLIFQRYLQSPVLHLTVCFFFHLAFLSLSMDLNHKDTATKLTTTQRTF